MRKCGQKLLQKYQRWLHGNLIVSVKCNFCHLCESRTWSKSTTIQVCVPKSRRYSKRQVSFITQTVTPCCPLSTFCEYMINIPKHFLPLCVWLSATLRLIISNIIILITLNKSLNWGARSHLPDFTDKMSDSWSNSYILFVASFMTWLFILWEVIRGWVSFTLVMLIYKCKKNIHL